MFRGKNESYEDYEKRIQRTAEILFPNTPDKPKKFEEKKSPKILPLGKSIFDEEDKEIWDGKVTGKSELDALVNMDKKENKNSSDKEKKYPYRKERTPEEEEEFLNEFYPSMRHLGKDKINQNEDEKAEKDKKGNFMGGAAGISNNKGEKEYKISADDGDDKIEVKNLKNQEGNKIMEKNISEKKDIDWKDDKDFNNAMKYLYPSEGNYSNRKEDLGGPTNLGVTQSTFDWYNKKHKLPKKDVKNITKGEAEQIYHEYFWKQSGASDIKDKKLALLYFDAAVNHGPYYAKKYYKESKGDFDKFMQLRKDHYKRMADNIKGQDKNYNGWMNRLNKLQKYAEENY